MVCMFSDKVHFSTTTTTSIIFGLFVVLIYLRRHAIKFDSPFYKVSTFYKIVLILF